MKKIIIAGSINMDIVSELDRYPKAGETVLGKKISFIPGGKGANQARAIARLGGNVKLIARVGDDEFGKTLIKSLDRDGVDSTGVKISAQNSSGVAIIGVEKSAENRIIVISGANFDLSEKDFSDIDLTKYQIAISNFEIPQKAVWEFFKKAKKANMTTILNPSPPTKTPKDYFKLIDYLIVNEQEFAYFSKVKGSKTTIITTLGSKGSMAVQAGHAVKAGGFKVKAVDTTGAGDSFLGGFAQSLAEKKNLKDALTFANAAAALQVTRLGASSMPNRKDVEAFNQKSK